MQTKHIKRFSPPAFISRLLQEAEIPKSKKLVIKYANGKLTARLPKPKYDQD